MALVKVSDELSADILKGLKGVKNALTVSNEY